MQKKLIRERIVSTEQQERIMRAAIAKQAKDRRIIEVFFAIRQVKMRLCNLNTAFSMEPYGTQMRSRTPVKARHTEGKR
ncbi:hypothetical protein LXA47_21230 [Massilia sp. P8910]|nr:hypothetical protein [Massilia antarctica]